MFTGFLDGEATDQGQVTLLKLKPGANLVHHCGPTNKRLTAHLGLKIPEKVFIEVGDDIFSWIQDKLIVFDDSFIHQVWHKGTQDRFVMYISVFHPDLISKGKLTKNPAVENWKFWNLKKTGKQNVKKK